jgi:UDP-3-O-[3-hydroxymyristoyl] glucosamine N-acyltransferase
MTLFLLSDVLKTIQHDVLDLVGTADRRLCNVSSIDGACDDQTITFCTTTGHTRDETIAQTRAGVILCKKPLTRDTMTNKTLIAVTNPRLSFLRIVRSFFQPPHPSGIHPAAVIDPRAKLSSNIYIGPFTHVGQCSIGEGTVIYGNIHIYANTRIGRNVIIHAGAVIGADGFGFEKNEGGEWEKFPHIGGVIIEDNVEIGANTCIDRGTLGDTILREGVKTDNLVHIAHNVVVGRRSLVIAHAMVAGSVRIGEDAWIAPSACIKEKTRIGNRSIVGLSTLVLKDVPDDVTVAGIPARILKRHEAPNPK